MNEWYVKFPGNFYPFSFWGDSEADVRQAARERLNVKRLPRGTEVWRVDHRSRAAMLADRRRNRYED